MKKYLFLIILPLLMFLPLKTNALINLDGSQINQSLLNVPGITCNSRDVCYLESSDFFGDTTYQISLGTNNRIYNNYNANYFYVMAYTRLINSDPTLQLDNTYSYTLGYWGNGSYSCIQLSNNNDKNLGYTTWKCPIPQDGYISGFRFFTNFIQNDSNLQVASTYRFGIYKYFLAFEIDGSLETDKTIQEQTDKIISESQKTQDKIDETNQTLEETKDYITSDEEPEADVSSLGNVQGLLPPGPVDSLLNIPFKFLSIIVSSLGDLCVPLSMNWVFNQTLTLPCFSDSFYDNVPSGLMVFINLIPSGFILIIYFKHLYKKVNRAVSMETTADDEWGVL